MNNDGEVVGFSYEGFSGRSAVGTLSAPLPEAPLLALLPVVGLARAASPALSYLGFVVQPTCNGRSH